MSDDVCLQLPLLLRHRLLQDTLNLRAPCAQGRLPLWGFRTVHTLSLLLRTSQQAVRQASSIEWPRFAPKKLQLTYR